jgi:outer membrane receptor protein involved in Fe transport
VADTLAVGLVFSPSAVPGLSLALDYYEMKIDDAIGTLSAAQVIQNCHASGGSAPECAQITRPSPTAFPTEIRSLPQNIALLETSGVDIDASYRAGVGPGNLSLRLYASWLRTFKQQQSESAPVYEYAGRGVHLPNPWARPEWRGSLGLKYEVGNWGVSLSQQYIGAFELGSEEPNQIYARPDMGAIWYTDATLSYHLDGVELFLTANNLFDRDPPLIPGTTPGVNLPTILSLYDTVGRMTTIGARFNF